MHHRRGAKKRKWMHEMRMAAVRTPKEKLMTDNPEQPVITEVRQLQADLYGVWGTTPQACNAASLIVQLARAVVQEAVDFRRLTDIVDSCRSSDYEQMRQSFYGLAERLERLELRPFIQIEDGKTVTYQPVKEEQPATDPESFIRGQEFERNIQARRKEQQGTFVYCHASLPGGRRCTLPLRHLGDHVITAKEQQPLQCCATATGSGGSGLTFRCNLPDAHSSPHAFMEVEESQPEWCQHHRPHSFHVGDGRYLDAYVAAQEEGSPAVVITDLIIYCPYCGQRRPS